MATPELTAAPQPRRHRLPAGAGRAWLYAYAAIWVLTLATAGIVAVSGPTLQDATRRLLGLTLTPAANPAPDGWRVLALAAHNTPIAAWPLLLGLAGSQRGPRATAALDGLLLASTLANTIPVGAALGTYGTVLLPYVPQLPLEWAGLAAGYASWLAQRTRPLSARERISWLVILSGLLLAAAAVETSAVPHR